MKSTLELLVELQGMDQNTLSCLRGDLEKMQREEVSSTRSIAVANPEVYSRYLEGLERLLDLVCALEGYDRNAPVVVFPDPKPDPAEVVELESVAEMEAATRKWVSA